jgi:divalent metal cation (Fe/Co/Zn/Cd) transporter
MSDSTPSISVIISLYDSYLLTINTILLAFAILVAILTVIGFNSIKQYMRIRIQEEVNSSINSHDVKLKIANQVELKTREAGDLVYEDMQITSPESTTIKESTIQDTTEK